MRVAKLENYVLVRNIQFSFGQKKEKKIKTRRSYQKGNNFRAGQ